MFFRKLIRIAGNSLYLIILLLCVDEKFLKLVFYRNILNLNFSSFYFAQARVTKVTPGKIFCKSVPDNVNY